jgi:hypothetical protein
MTADAAGSVDAILRFQGPGERVDEEEDHFSLFVAFDAVKACPLFDKSVRDTVSPAPFRSLPVWQLHPSHSTSTITHEMPLPMPIYACPTKLVLHR